MEGEEVYVEEHNLRDQDVVSNWQRRGEDALSRGLSVCQCGDGGHDLTSDDGILERAVHRYFFDVRGDVGEDL